MSNIKKVFIDGSAGTTGLRIHERLAERKDIIPVTLPEEYRKDPKARKELINSSDIVFLCLPDDAAKEAVSMADNPDTVIIDTSTAHRTADGWTYGFPELSGKREELTRAKRISNPGCHATGFISLVAPLVQLGVLPHNSLLSCFSITGYSGGGKKMIAEYEAEPRDPLFSSPRQYGLSQQHKHLKEMTAVCELNTPPVFCPVVADFYSGMEVTVSVFKQGTGVTPESILGAYRDYYLGSRLIHVDENVRIDGYMPASAYSGRDDMQISVCGNDERIILVSRFDNLGKGASGAAVQNMNLLLGVPEETGLVF